MKVLGTYCKGYLVSSLREFSGWEKSASNVKNVKPDGQEVIVERALEDDDILYVQENYTVTDGVFMGENVVFDRVTPEWIEFCKTNLKFDVPVYESGNQTEVADRTA